MIRLVLVRHAETVANAAGRWQGQSDSPLSTRGHAQAAALAARLGGVHFARRIASDLTRAADTARAVGGQELELDPALREIDAGSWEGLSREEVTTRYPTELAAMRRGEPLPVGGGESWAAARDRVLGALARATHGCRPGERVLVVGHGGVLFAAIGRLLRLAHPFPLTHLVRLTNTAVSILDVTPGLPPDGVVRLVAYNDATHVESVAPAARERLADGDVMVRWIAADDVDDALSLPAVAVPTAPGTVHERLAASAAIGAATAAHFGLDPRDLGVTPPRPGTHTDFVAGAKVRLLVSYGAGLSDGVTETGAAGATRTAAGETSQ